MARRIPIRNLYYLLCYAWNVLEERDDTLADQLEGLSHVELLGKVLATSVSRLWRRSVSTDLVGHHFHRDHRGPGGPPRSRSGGVSTASG